MSALVAADAPESGSRALLATFDETFLDDSDTVSSELSELEENEAAINNGDARPRNADATAKLEQRDDSNTTTASTLRPTPAPSKKRRESEGGADATPEVTDLHRSKKRKRGPSPPWQFPTAEKTTLKTADGRRISARFNTSTSTPNLSDNDGRGRSSSLSAPPVRSSPPWKKFEAHGPTSLVVDGKRKSGRVHREQPEAADKQQVSPKLSKKIPLREDERVTKPAAPPNTTVNLNGEAHVKSPTLHTKKPATHHPPRPSDANADDSASKIAELRAQIEALKPSRSFPSPNEQQVIKRSHKRKPSAEKPASMPQNDAPSSPPPTHRKHARPTLSPETSRPSPKIKLRFTTPRHIVPPPHPNALIPSPPRPPRLSIFQQIETYELQELQQPYLENERGPPDLSWFHHRSDRQALDESRLRRRILTESHVGGVLSKERPSLYQDSEPQPEPPKQYGHGDYLTAHVLHLRDLQKREKNIHRFQAKKVAQEAVEYWKARRGPTEEDLREEADKIFRLIYRQCVLDVRARWELVQSHVGKERVKKWEEGKERERQERLREKLEWSENMVARQRGEAGEGQEDGFSEDVGSEEGDGDGGEESSEEENMSESGSEAGSEEKAEEEEAEGTSGEMGEDELAAYLAQREVEVEPPDKLDESTEVTTAQLDISTAEADEEQPHPETGNAELEADRQDVSMADLLGDNDDDEADEAGDEFEPPREDADPAQQAARRSRRSSAVPGQEHATESEDFSEDESTDMDSEDYDSDEDMSSTGSEDNDAAGDENEGSGDDERSVPKNSLLSLFKDEIKDFEGLPTPPTTSAEGDDVEPDHSDAKAGAVEEQVVPNGADETIEAALWEPDTADEESQAVSAPIDLPAPELVDEDEEMEVDSETKHLIPAPALLRGTLRSYQHAGLDWLASLYRSGTNGILADEMGLGKTIQTIALLAHLAEEHEVWETHLVIVPTSVILNWVTEFQKFLPGFRVLGYYGTAEERQVKRRGWVNDPHHENKEKRGYNVVITSYNVAMQDINAIRNVAWHYLVLDEAHNIRNFNSQRWQVLIRLRTKARLMLTGTPLQNSLTELWSLLTFLTAGDDNPAHGDLEEFLSHWKEPVREIFDRGVQTLSTEAQKVVDQLHVSLRPFLLRRLKSEVEKDLPKKTESVVVCKLSKRQRQLYQDYMGLADTKKNLVQGNAVTAGKVLMSLRRVCNHPDLFDPRPIQTSWGLEGSVVEGFDGREKVVRRLLGGRSEFTGELWEVSGFEWKGAYVQKRAKQLDGTPKLQEEADELKAQVQADSEPDSATMAGYLALQRHKQRQRKLDQLRSCIRVSEHSIQAAPVYGSDLREIVTLRNDRSYKVAAKDRYGRVATRSLRGWPALGRFPLRFESEHPADWTLSKTTILQRSVMTADRYAEQMQDSIVRFAFCTPAVTAPVLDYQIPPKMQERLRASDAYPTETDYAHEARVRSSIVFPDSRLLVYDSGKLQRLTHLLRELQAKGSRSLIFTQMTGTLNVLERFLNLLGLPYLRLDGSTPVERRQLYSAEFNRPDSKYQCMILSSRAGGIGLNLVGASSVIFYDLDWNPQMDRQCMDRAHRIGQVRDVEVFKMVSEKTVEENILRRAEQKSLLDQTVIQEGHFTTDYQRESQQRQGPRDGESEDDVAAAIERFLGGGNEKATNQALESVEDKEDVQAAQAARKEEHQDDADFAENKSSKDASRAATPGHGLGEEVEDEERKGHLDSYMIKWMEEMLKDVTFAPPQPQGRKDKNGRDRSHRPRKR